MDLDEQLRRGGFFFFVENIGRVPKYSAYIFVDSLSTWRGGIASPIIKVQFRFSAHSENTL
jgi:hypothetical protein